MSKAKKDVLDMIDKKAKQIRDIRKKSSKSRTPKELVLQFLEEVEPIYSIAKSAGEFYAMLDLITKDLDNKMKIIDYGVSMEVEWNGAEDWRNLRASGIRIRWSKFYQNRYGVEEEQYIDITTLLLEDFDEEQV